MTVPGSILLTAELRVKQQRLTELTELRDAGRKLTVGQKRGIEILTAEVADLAGRISRGEALENADVPENTPLYRSMTAQRLSDAECRTGKYAKTR